jgi:protein arginine kinase
MMRFATILKNPARWMLGPETQPQVVVSSRIRLARNLADASFPGRAAVEERRRVLERVFPALESLGEMRDAFARPLDELNAVEKKVLVERHLISREQAGNASGSGVVINRAQSLSIMVNEEDHLRMQAMFPGLALHPAHAMLDAVDTALEENLDFAFDDRLGYLTSCPSNVGTGLRASVMVHLPGLVLSDQINKVVAAVNKIGLAVRGLFGEGSEAQSNLFQVSNQTTLGESESDIIDRLTKVIEQVISSELNARAKLLEDKPGVLCDHIGRAYGILRHSRIIDTKEALNHLSMLRLGMDLGFLPALPGGDSIDLLLMDIQPAHLQWQSRAKLTPEQRDGLRSRILRERLGLLPEPEIRHPSSNGADEPPADVESNQPEDS